MNQDHYRNIEEDSVISKIRRSLYLIVSVSLLTHTMSIIYSIMSFREMSMGFIAIIVSSLTCFLLSSSHLTIYGISVLGILYITMIEAYGNYTRPQICYIVAISGVAIIPFWRMVHSAGAIFHCLPGRMHAAMVFGVVLIVLTKFFPLAIENIKAFFIMSTSSALTNPLQIIITTFSEFNVLTLALTIGCIAVMIVLRDKLNKIPFIALLVLIGIAINWKQYFLSTKHICKYTDPADPTKPYVDCNFYILNLKNLISPSIEDLLTLIPASLVLSAVLLFEQFLYLEQFERRGKRFNGGGDLGDVKTETRVLALANTISGCLGGLPICINLFGTYENFAFNQKYGFQGTKWVGLLQIPVSYCLYSFAKPIYDIIPLFILFTIVATPAIYFLRNMLSVHANNILIITVVAALNVLTHPIIALIFACLISIYDMAQLLKPAPAEILIQLENEERKSIAKVPEKQQEIPQEPKMISQFVNRVVQIDDDVPEDLQGRSYVMFRFTGAISYLNCYTHLDELKLIADQYCYNTMQGKEVLMVLSFRYSQVIDEESLYQLSELIQIFRKDRVRVVLTGLHLKLMQKMEKIQYFRTMLQQDEKCMFSIQQAPESVNA